MVSCRFSSFPVCLLSSCFPLCPLRVTCLSLCIVPCFFHINIHYTNPVISRIILPLAYTFLSRPLCWCLSCCCTSCCVIYCLFCRASCLCYMNCCLFCSLRLFLMHCFRYSFFAYFLCVHLSLFLPYEVSACRVPLILLSPGLLRVRNSRLLPCKHCIIYVSLRCLCPRSQI